MKEFNPNVGLPKWPQMLTYGRSVTPEQALEIIRRTDTFFTHGYGSNAHRFDEDARRIVGLPPERWGVPEPDETEPQRIARLRREWAIEEQWRVWWDCVDTGYVHNSFVSSAFIGGPHGWCHPDGLVYFADNVGKWPSVEAITEDWKTLLDAFPFIDLGVVLMDNESSDEEAQPLIGIRVGSGAVTLMHPDDALHDFEGANLQELRKRLERDWDQAISLLGTWNPEARECAFSRDQIKKWRDQVVAAKGQFVYEEREESHVECAHDEELQGTGPDAAEVVAPDRLGLA